MDSSKTDPQFVDSVAQEVGFGPPQFVAPIAQPLQPEVALVLRTSLFAILRNVNIIVQQPTIPSACTPEGAPVM